MRKLLELDQYFPKTGEPTVQLAAFANQRGGLSIEKRAFAEGHSQFYDFLKTVQPEPGITYLLVNAMGSWEYYDLNRNADGFPERAYMVGTRAKCGHPDCTLSLDGWVSEPETLVHHYKTFEESGGIYRHHKNDDPSKSRGTVKPALWNARMHRVELLLRYVNSRDPEIPSKIADGVFPAVSMGCRVAYDVCTICGHRAPTRAQYCSHALSQMNAILPDGRKVGVLNPRPRFFDISFVFRPADPTGWTLQKVARHGGMSSAELGELMDRAEGSRLPFWSTAKEINASWDEPGSFMGRFVRGSFPSGKVAGAPSTLLELAASPVPHPQSLVAKLASQALGIPLTDDMVDRLVCATPALVALVGESSETVKHASFGEAGDVLRDRAYAPWPDVPSVDVGPGALHRAAEPPRTDLLTMTDPFTGAVYQTTRGAAQDATREDVKKRLLNTALLTGLYAAGLHKALKPTGLGGLGRAAVALPVGALLGRATERGIHNVLEPYRHPYYQTDQGVPVSGGTEFKAASIEPSSWARKLASDLEERDAARARIARRGGHRFLKWAASPLDLQVRSLAGEDRAPEEPYAVRPDDARDMAERLTFLLTT